MSTLLGLSFATTTFANSDKSITGTWIVNEEATETLQNKVRRSSSTNPALGSGPTVLGIPSPGNSGPSGPNSTLKFPEVLECEEISFEVDEEAVKASCASGVTREFLIGNIHGRITRFRRNILTESYSSTSRSVKHDIRVDKDGNLVAKVRIRPKNGVSQTYVRVYSRPPATDEEEIEVETEIDPDVDIDLDVEAEVDTTEDPEDS
ncbi:MAG: hypothetical protein F4X56_07940 [Gammaproteobacteria bacterium]|nr:hypothetical protein [Gammaproteobacteria bacterium]MYC25830.1 hypothetical protein [Gammaproteobacteria bacterium]